MCILHDFIVHKRERTCAHCCFRYRLFRDILSQRHLSTAYLEISYHNDIFSISYQNGSHPNKNALLLSLLLRLKRQQTLLHARFSHPKSRTGWRRPELAASKNWLAPAGAGGQQEEKWHMKTPAAPPAARLSESDQAIHREKNRHPSSRDPCDGR